MLEAKLNYRSLLRIGNDITEWLSYEEAIRQYAAKKMLGGKKCYRDVRKFMNKISYFLWVL